MNLHKVKGLEAPVVFLAIQRGNSSIPIDLHIDRSGAIVRGYMAVFGPKSNVGYARTARPGLPLRLERLEDNERDFQQAENERLLYVAATRAGYVLGGRSPGKEAQRQPLALVDGRSFGSRDPPGPGPASSPYSYRATSYATTRSKLRRRRSPIGGLA